MASHQSPEQKETVERVMHEFKHGELRIRGKLRPIIATAWAADAFAGGSYSYARVYHSGDRCVLAAPVNGRIFFAGEACSESDYSNAHGAYMSGVRAAEEVLGAVGMPAIAS